MILPYMLSGMLVLTMFSSLTAAQGAPLAFPGAEGFGQFTQGGRGGRVIEVTNLNDSGAGSFREAIEASGPRTVVFTVAGVISSSNRFRIKNPYLTIAGQTAPGDGITIEGLLDLRVGEIIIRHIRIRPGFVMGRDTDALLIWARDNDITNIIMDHISTTWGSDETISVISYEPYSARNITLQWSHVTNALHCAGLHAEGCHGRGSLLRGHDLELSMHHNLIGNFDYRLPKIGGGDLDLVNNVIYNWGYMGTMLDADWSPVRINIVNNSYLPGPDTRTDGLAIRLDARENFLNQSVYFLDGNTHPVLAPLGTIEKQPDLLYIKAVWPSTSTRLDYPMVTTTSAPEAMEEVLSKSGATLPSLDPIDQRIVDSVRNGTGRIINNISAVDYEFLRNIPLASRVSNYDSDHDGMPDSWELAWGLLPNNASDGPKDLDGDGYTNLEEYLNGTEPGKDTVPPAPPLEVRIEK